MKGNALEKRSASSDGEGDQEMNSVRLKFMSRRTILIFVVAAMSIIALTRFFATKLTMAPKAVVAYRRGESDFDKAILAITSGKAELRADGQGFMIDPPLRKRGVSYVRQNNEFVVFSFESLPPDALPEIIYSPNGFQALRLPTDHAGQNLLVHLEQLRYQWFYWERD
jgi:hypothetical protein